MATRTNPSRIRPGRPRRALSPVGRAVQDIETNFDRDWRTARAIGLMLKMDGLALSRRSALMVPPTDIFSVSEREGSDFDCFIPVSQVALIVPRLERIWLSGPVRVVESEASEPGSVRSRLGRRDTTWP
jgi:hypothetical protein